MEVTVEEMKDYIIKLRHIEDEIRATRRIMKMKIRKHLATLGLDDLEAGI